MFLFTFIPKMIDRRKIQYMNHCFLQYMKTGMDEKDGRKERTQALETSLESWPPVKHGSHPLPVKSQIAP